MKARFPFAEAFEVATRLATDLAPGCSSVCVAGSLRRKRPDVGDIELVYVPRFVKACPPGELFNEVHVNAADAILRQLLECGVLDVRLNVNGARAWGEKNKLAVHVASGIPVDFFSTTEHCYPNYLVCRTGPAELNARIAKAALAKGWCWHPYADGFTSLDGLHRHRVGSEQEVFDFVGLPYLEPEARQ